MNTNKPVKHYRRMVGHYTLSVNHEDGGYTSAVIDNETKAILLALHGDYIEKFNMMNSIADVEAFAKR